ncbi:LysR family transcriptional regulator [Acidisoma cladoniae]|jgi:DNA-binding transcriptional LysR family regulator|uniref:LysR family transcriptional regulator n=1 Tax=Acidisoma cladoniae TaxID=3040935 RepID=UPI00254ECBDF|nr:LysR family transcriptional regulator [Acidisoma sp. PAMC 29798]
MADRAKLSRLNALADFDIRLLRVFIAVVEEGGYVGAQARLNISPSTLSEHIKDLEYRLGCTVCLRGRSGFKLTEQGDSLYKAARTLFGQLEAFRNQVSDIAGRAEGTLNIGVVDGLATETMLRLPDVLREFSSLKPLVVIDLSVGSPPDLELSLLQGELDVIVGPFPAERPGLLYEKLYDESESLFCGLGNPLFGRPSDALSDEEVCNLPLVALDYPSFANLQRFKPHVFARTIEAATLLILSGKYIGFLPRHVTLPHVKNHLLWEIDEARYAFCAAFSVVSRDVNVMDPFLKLLLTLLRRKRSGDVART